MEAQTQQPSVLVILTESPIRGSVSVSITEQNVDKISRTAVANALETLRTVAEEVVTNIKRIKVTERPTKAELEFGLLLTTDAKAFIVNASAAAHFKVTLTWEKPIESPEDQESEHN
ncbi:MAG: hypothetical protein IPO91_18790 [Chloroflexi bacterium]|nr:hypothetical protein [Chloroflexota bacterium]